MFKLAYKNFTENTVRTLAVIITVALAAVMLFMCFVYKQVIYEEFLNSKSVEAENADISIEYSPESNSRIITAAPLGSLTDNFEFAVGVLDLYGTATVAGEIQYINIKGVDEEGFDKINKITYKETIGRALRSDEIIIDRSTSDALNLKIDSHIAITINGITKTFYVAKIAEDHSCFKISGAYVIYGMEEFVSEYVNGGYGNIYNKIFIKLTPEANIDTVIEQIQAIEEYSRYTVAEENSVKSVTKLAGDISLPIVISLSGCAVLTVYLVYLIFNAGLKRKTLFISRLKTIGASENYISGIFLLESLFYSAAGIILGLIANFLVLKFGVTSLMNINVESAYYTARLIVSAVICFMLVLACTVIPIFKIRGVSIKAAFINSKNSSWKTVKAAPFAAIIMIITAIILVSPHYLSAIRGITAFVFGFTGMIILLPYIARGISCLLKKLSLNSVYFTAVNNFGRERLSAINLRIIFAGIIICSLIISAANLTKNIASSILSDVDCDIVIKNVDGDTNTQFNNIKATEGLYDVYALSIKKSVLTFNGEELSLSVLGLNPGELDLMGDFEYITPEADLITGLESGLALDYMYHKVYKINIGDDVSLTIGGTAKTVTITAFYNSYQYGGRTAMMGSALMSELYDLPLYDTIICKTDKDIDTMVSMLRANNGANNLIVLNKIAALNFYLSVYDSTVTFAYYFSLFIILICFFNIITNILNFRTETRSAKYQMFSMGFSKNIIMLTELIEFSLTALLAFAMAMLFVPLVNYAVSNILSISDFYFKTVLSAGTTALTGVGFAAVLIITALTSHFSVDSKKLLKILKFD